MTLAMAITFTYDCGSHVHSSKTSWLQGLVSATVAFCKRHTKCSEFVSKSGMGIGADNRQATKVHSWRVWGR